MTESDHAPGRETDANYSHHIVGDVADQFLQSWATWEWKNFYRGANVPPSQLASEYGAHVTGNAPAWPPPPPGQPPAPLSFFQKAYARTYAPAIAGAKHTWLSTALRKAMIHQDRLGTNTRKLEG
jgi:hypothetical protein